MSQSSIRAGKGESLWISAFALTVGGLLFLSSAVQAPRPALAETAKPAAEMTAFSADQKAQIEAIIKNYLLTNPELMVEVQHTLEAKQEAQRQDMMTKAVANNADSLFKNSALPMTGDAKGDVTVVEFFDYNCGFCKRAIDQVGKVIDGDKKLRMVFVDFPIFGKDSDGSARVAIAAGKQGKYWELHKDMLAQSGHMTEDVAYKLAEKHGLDMAKLKADAESDSVKNLLSANRALADKMGIQGTPHFVIGEKIIPGAPEDLYDQMASMIKDVRVHGCKVC